MIEFVAAAFALIALVGYIVQKNRAELTLLMMNKPEARAQRLFDEAAAQQQAHNKAPSRRR
ncbi:hypothetical protein SAMN06273572_104175 [Monaibacterium marinum]|uniref:Uncharacterized protein n=1 Tax=Pontivivens marinum TaxID=1690039 RepID=A0A2C9CSY8_9RHOB|nr:hypothetical protein [Monaibacterium marinum]SOH94476.1 hypothetical protein SAMN06273572_104175 [Monaibacterium marinum]